MSSNDTRIQLTQLTDELRFQVQATYKDAPNPALPAATLAQMNDLLGRAIWEAGCYHGKPPTPRQLALLSDVVRLGIRLLNDMPPALERGNPNGSTG